MNSTRYHVIGLIAVALGVGGCGRQTRGNADAQPGGPAAADRVMTDGSASQSKEYGDTQSKRAYDASGPSQKSTTGGASTGGPGSNEKKEVTIQQSQPAGNAPSSR